MALDPLNQKGLNIAIEMSQVVFNSATRNTPLMEYRDCPACGRSLDGLPVAARFCPACGAIIRLPQMIFDSWLGKLLGIAKHRSHFLIREGYANAMLHLGWKYESGLGTARNPAEALRCYCKSVRLGNHAALARITHKPVITISETANENGSPSGI
jgi:TPR repeat protein